MPTVLAPGLTYQAHPADLTRTILQIREGQVTYEETNHQAASPKRVYRACSTEDFTRIAGPCITIGTPPIVLARDFAFNNRSGGTGLSDGRLSCPAFEHPSAAIQIFRGFDDWETGWRFIGIPADPAIAAYLEAQAAPGYPLVYVSEFSAVNRRSVQPLIEFLDQQVF